MEAEAEAKEGRWPAPLPPLAPLAEWEFAAISISIEEVGHLFDPSCGLAEEGGAKEGDEGATGVVVPHSSFSTCSALRLLTAGMEAFPMEEDEGEGAKEADPPPSNTCRAFCSASAANRLLVSSISAIERAESNGSSRWRGTAFGGGGGADGNGPADFRRKQ